MFVFDVTYNKYVISFNDIKSLNDISSAPQILSFGFPGSPHFKPGQIIKIETQNVENQITKELIVVAYGMPSSFNERSFLCLQDSFICTLGEFVIKLSYTLDTLYWWKGFIGACFALYGIQNLQFFILHNELSIIKMDMNGKILWEFAGRDIFLLPINIEEDAIFVIDDLNNKYKIDVINGKNILD